MVSKHSRHSTAHDNNDSHPDQLDNYSTLKIVAVALAILFIAIALYDFSLDQEKKKVENHIDSEITNSLPVPEIEAVAIQHPVPAPVVSTPAENDSETKGSSETVQTEPAPPLPFDPAAPLPDLYGSDEPLLAILSQVIDAKAITTFFNIEAFISRFVITVDNMPLKSLPYKHMVLKTVPGEFKIKTENEETIYLGPENFRRYEKIMGFVEGIDIKSLIPVYAYFYPLFQEAYVELGYPNRYFNDRLIEVIDHLLETPEVKGLIKLKRPHVRYQYADPELEALSAGQKILVRIGLENSRIMRKKLQELKEALLELSSRTDP